ncbi:hypothetical protein JTE90_017194 [Oedothorax gibbosus]|uniref:BRCA1-associated RING domain protein 1 n=1 Tax=Oedothorax gibbosus TaxID=931172 RepID=A0AAV6V7A0_9ARAC|nr:hypothetical protein JTE90_017194 [Oedothorax gibbosus]
MDPSTKDVILERIQSLEEALKCKICSNLLKDPVVIQKCGHSSCKQCSVRHKSSSCPVCDIPVTTRDALDDRPLRELIVQLQLLRHLVQEGECAAAAFFLGLEEVCLYFRNRILEFRDPLYGKDPAGEEDQRPPTLTSTPKPGRPARTLPTFTPSKKQQTPVGRVGRKKLSPSTPHLNKKNHKGETLLHRTVIKGDMTRVRELLDQGAEVNTQDNNGWTPLHEASNHGHLELASLLLERGALPNVPSLKDLVTPLHDALLNHYQMDMAALLVSKGADPHARTSFGYTALDLCRSEEDKNRLAEACSPFIQGSTLPIHTQNKGSKVVLLPSNLDEGQKQQLAKCAALLQADLAEDFTEQVSHVVTSCDAEGNCTRTMKVLLGVLGGKWIMNFQWVEVCLEYGRRVDEEAFEAQGTKNQPSTQGPKRGRCNTQQKFPGLFCGLQFYLHGQFSPPTPSREELRNLITLGGGRILSREPRPQPTGSDEEREIPYHAVGTPLEHVPNVILYQDRPPRDTHLHEGGVCTSQAMWVVACISQFKLLPPQQTGSTEK